MAIEYEYTATGVIQYTWSGELMPPVTLLNELRSKKAEVELNPALDNNLNQPVLTTASSSSGYGFGDMGRGLLGASKEVAKGAAVAAGLVVIAALSTVNGATGNI